MWVARDKIDGRLTLYFERPYRLEDSWSSMTERWMHLCFYDDDDVYHEIPGFETLKFEDEPIEVELKIKS